MKHFYVIPVFLSPNKPLHQDIHFEWELSLHSKIYYLIIRKSGIPVGPSYRCSYIYTECPPENAPYMFLKLPQMTKVVIKWGNYSLNYYLSMQKQLQRYWQNIGHFYTPLKFQVWPKTREISFLIEMYTLLHIKIRSFHSFWS